MDSSFSPSGLPEPLSIPAPLPDDGPSWLVTFSDLVLQLFAFLLIGLVVSHGTTRLGAERRPVPTRLAEAAEPAPTTPEARTARDAGGADVAMADAEVVRLAPARARSATTQMPAAEPVVSATIADAPPPAAVAMTVEGATEQVSQTSRAAGAPGGIPAVTSAQLQATGRYLAALVAGVAGEAAPEVTVGEHEVLITLGEGIGFDSGRSELGDAARSVLEELRAILRGMPGAAIEVSGHTDDRPIHTAQYPSNLELSLARAAAVASHLGRDEAELERRIFAAGYAERRPRAANTDDRGRAQNRRVEVRLVALR